MRSYFLVGDDYLCMTMESAGHREFEFPEKAAKKYGIAPSTFRKKVTELQNRGFIRLVSSGKSTRQPNDYVFTDTWKNRAG